MEKNSTVPIILTHLHLTCCRNIRTRRAVAVAHWQTALLLRDLVHSLSTPKESLPYIPYLRYIVHRGSSPAEQRITLADLSLL